MVLELENKLAREIITGYDGVAPGMTSSTTRMADRSLQAGSGAPPEVVRVVTPRTTLTTPPRLSTGVTPPKISRSMSLSSSRADSPLSPDSSAPPRGTAGSFSPAMAPARMAELIRLALKNGASGVVALPVADESGYEDAFAQLAGMEDIALAICGSTDLAVQKKLRDSVAEASGLRRERLCVAAGAKDETVEGLGLGVDGRKAHQSAGAPAADHCGSVVGGVDPRTLMYRNAHTFTTPWSRSGSA